MQNSVVWIDTNQSRRSCSSSKQSQKRAGATTDVGNNVGRPGIQLSQQCVTPCAFPSRGGHDQIVNPQQRKGRGEVAHRSIAHFYVYLPSVRCSSWRHSL